MTEKELLELLDKAIGRQVAWLPDLFLAWRATLPEAKAAQLRDMLQHQIRLGANFSQLADGRWTVTLIGIDHRGALYPLDTIEQSSVLPALN